MKTRIIVDSTADLMPEYTERVHTVPLTVNFGTEEFEEFFKSFLRPQLVEMLFNK